MPRSCLCLAYAATVVVTSVNTPSGTCGRRSDTTTDTADHPNDTAPSAGGAFAAAASVDNTTRHPLVIFSPRSRRMERRTLSAPSRASGATAPAMSRGSGVNTAISYVSTPRRSTASASDSGENPAPTSSDTALPSSAHATRQSSPDVSDATTLKKCASTVGQRTCARRPLARSTSTMRSSMNNRAPGDTGAFPPPPPIAACSRALTSRAASRRDNSAGSSNVAEDAKSCSAAAVSTARSPSAPSLLPFRLCPAGPSAAFSAVVVDGESSARSNAPNVSKMTSHAVPNVAANLCATLNSVRSACMFFGVRTTSTRASESATRSERLPPPRTNDNAPRTGDAIAPTAALPTAPAALTPRLNAPAMSPVRSPTAPIPGAGSKSRDDIERGPLVDASTGARSRSRSRSDSEGASAK